MKEMDHDRYPKAIYFHCQTQPVNTEYIIDVVGYLLIQQWCIS